MSRFLPLLVVCLTTVPLSAADGWIDLLAGDSLEAFQKPSPSWGYCETIGLDPTNAKKFAAKAGKGILWNGDKGKAPDLYSKAKFADIEVELEFMIPKGANAGIKFHGHYEIQIIDSFGKKEPLEGDDCGGIYPKATMKPSYHHLDKGIGPKVNACKAPGEWQTLAISFRAPTFDAEGKKKTNATIVRATLNGKLLHENQEILYPTGHRFDNPEMHEAPLMIQGDHGAIALRVFRVRSVK